MKFFSTLVASTLGVLIASGILLFLFILFVVAIAASGGEKPTINRQSVLTIDLEGTIPERGAADPIVSAITNTPSFGLLDVVDGIRYAQSDDRIKALWIRSKGSSFNWASLEEIRSALLDFKESGKPIIASATGSGISEEEYFLMSVADSVFALPAAPFEFNGFYIAAEFYKRTMDLLEIDPQIIRSGKYKGAVEPYFRTDLSAENQEQLSRILEMRHNRFATAVAESRDIELQTVQDLLAGTTVTSAEDAVQNGLVDRLAYADQIEDAVRLLTETADGDDLSIAPMRSYASVTPTEVGLAINRKNEIAVLYAEGVIQQGQSVEGSAVGSVSFRKAVEAVRDRDAVKAVVLRINSPGGSATASDEMLQELRLLAAEKPVVVSMGPVAASGGYWIAMAADTIVADPMTITGSIGVYAMFLDVGDLFSEKLGVDVDVVKTGKNADMLSGFRELTATERQALESGVDQTYDRFLELVASNRSMTTAQVNELAQGRVWTGSDALDRGLVDALGGLTQSIHIAAQMVDVESGDYVVTTYPKPTSFWEQLNSRMDNTIQVLARRIVPETTFSPLEQQALRRVRQIEELLRDAATVQARMPWTITVN